MESDFRDLLPKVLLSVPFGVGAAVLFIMAVRRFGRFFMMDYQGNSKARFKDNLVGHVYMTLGIGCIMFVVSALTEVGLSWGLLSVLVLIGVFVIPIGVAGGYWQSYWSNRLWGGLMPIARAKSGYGQLEPAKRLMTDLSNIRLSLRTTITALLAALLVFFGLYFALYGVNWNGTALSGLMFRMFISGLGALGVFMTICSAALSSRIQRMRDGEPPED